jgi:DNA-binding NarL/FixJ family response regulator
MPPKKDPTHLGPRELQLVELIRQGLTNKEIAYEMALTQGSVKEYIHRIFEKLHVRNRTALAMWSQNHTSIS